MARWFLISDAMLDDPSVQRLSDREFRKRFTASLQGEANGFSKFIKPISGRPSWNEWAALRSLVFERDDFTCQYCGDRGVRLECDHVIPVSRGGSSDPANLKTACFPCNRSKRAKTLAEWKR